VKRVEGLEGVVIVLALVIEPGQTRSQHEILSRQDLVPKVLNCAHLGKEPVAADVETPPVSFDGPRDPAHLVVGFQNSTDLAPPRQLESSCQARRSGADDDDVRSRFRWVVGAGHRFVKTADR
jgi:hypothetical protein